MDRAESGFFCADCESEFKGMPSGSRKGDQRPLCERCATRGALAGTAETAPWISGAVPAVPTAPPAPCPSSSSMFGITILAVLVALVVIVAYAWYRATTK